MSNPAFPELYLSAWLGQWRQTVFPNHSPPFGVVAHTDGTLTVWLLQQTPKQLRIDTAEKSQAESASAIREFIGAEKPESEEASTYI